MKTHNRRLMCGTRCAILGWYDLLCLFCYIGQSRKAVPAWHGFTWSTWTFQRFAPKFHAVGFRRE